MKLSRLITAASLAAPLLISIISCSGLSETTAGKKSGVYPQWYNVGQPFVSDGNGYRAYATALAGDSAAAAQKAGVHAGAELQSGISGKLESIRNKVAKGAGSNTVLATPGFILALREAEKEVAGTAKTINTIATSGFGSGHRGFAEVTAGKTALIEELNQAFEGRYEKAWNAMKESRAFEGF